MRIMGIIHTRMNITDAICNGIALKGGGGGEFCRVQEE